MWLNIWQTFVFLSFSFASFATVPLNALPLTRLPPSSSTITFPSTSGPLGSFCSFALSFLSYPSSSSQEEKSCSAFSCSPLSHKLPFFDPFCSPRCLPTHPYFDRDPFPSFLCYLPYFLIPSFAAFFFFFLFTFIPFGKERIYLSFFHMEREDLFPTHSQSPFLFILLPQA